MLTLFILLLAFSGDEAATNWTQEFTLASTLWFTGMVWHMLFDVCSCLTSVPKPGT